MDHCTPLPTPSTQTLLIHKDSLHNTAHKSRNNHEHYITLLNLICFVDLLQYLLSEGSETWMACRRSVAAEASAHLWVHSVVMCVHWSGAANGGSPDWPGMVPGRGNSFPAVLKKHAHIHTAINRIWDKVHSHFTASMKSYQRNLVCHEKFSGTILAAVIQSIMFK